MKSTVSKSSVGSRFKSSTVMFWNLDDNILAKMPDGYGSVPEFVSNAYRNGWWKSVKLLTSLLWNIW